MARRIHNAILDSKAARSKLERRSKPYLAPVEEGLALGYIPAVKAARGGKWLVRHYTGAEQYRQKTIGTADDINPANGVTVLTYWQAIEKARECLAENALLKSKVVLVDTVMADYLKYIRLEKKDHCNIENRIDNFILPSFKGREVASLTAKEIREWFHNIAATPAQKRTAKGAKLKYKELKTEEDKRKRKSTANRVRTTLIAALNRAFDDEDLGLKDNPWTRVKPFAKVDAAREGCLTVAECQRLINACEPDFRDLVKAALATGCRYQEIARLKVQDFNPDSNTLAILITKSGKARHLPLHAEAAAFFAALCAGRSRDELMIRRGPKGKAWKNSEQVLPLNAALARAGITSKFTFHGLRHSWASLSVMNGMPLMIVAHNLGHRDTSMVERHYGHLASDFKAEAIRTNAPRFGFEQSNKVASLDNRRG